MNKERCDSTGCIKHELFVTLYEAALGGRLEVPEILVLSDLTDSYELDGSRM